MTRLALQSAAWAVAIIGSPFIIAGGLVVITAISLANAAGWPDSDRMLAKHRSGARFVAALKAGCSGALVR